MARQDHDHGFIGQPRWFPIDLDRETGAIRFADIGLDRPNWRNLMDIGSGEKRFVEKSLPAAAAYKFLHDDHEAARINFIWHTAYCCSTAIATALDVPGRNLSLFEPQILISVAQARRQADRLHRGDISWLSDAVFRLMSRPYADGAVTVKPAPVSNYLAADAAATTKGRMLFLHSDCRSFLIASTRYGESRRRTVRHLFQEIRNDGAASEHWTAESVAGLTDLEIAGLTWQIQIARFAEHLKRLGPRAASLDCDAFLADPKGVLAKIWRFLEIAGSPEESELFHDPDFLHRHVKYPDEAFAPEMRLNAHPDPRIADEIERIAEASVALLPQGTLPLPNPLVKAEQ